MRLKVLKISEHQSKRNPDFRFKYVFFKSLDNGKSYRTCISEEFRNYRWWRDVKVGDILEVNDNMIYKNLIDADTIPKIITETEENNNGNKI